MESGRLVIQESNSWNEAIVANDLVVTRDLQIH